MPNIIHLENKNQRMTNVEMARCFLMTDVQNGREDTWYIAYLIV